MRHGYDPDLAVAGPKDYVIRESIDTHEAMGPVVYGPLLGVVANSAERLLERSLKTVRCRWVLVLIPHIAFDIVSVGRPVNM